MAPQLIRGPSGTPARHAGWLRFVPIAEGSHSAHEGPVVEGPAGAVRVYVVGDTPFENAAARQLQGSWVHIDGIWKNGVVRVDPKHLVVGSAPVDTTSIRAHTDDDPVDSIGLHEAQRLLPTESPPTGDSVGERVTAQTIAAQPGNSIMPPSDGLPPAPASRTTAPEVP